METNREKARKLYIEYRQEYHVAGFNQSAFHQRVRRLAKQVSSEKDWDAFMYLKYIETRMNAIFSFADKGDLYRAPVDAPADVITNLPCDARFEAPSHIADEILNMRRVDYAKYIMLESENK